MKFFKSMKEATELVASVSQENEELKAQLASVSDKLTKFDEQAAALAQAGEAIAAHVADNSEKAAKIEELSKQIVSLEGEKVELSTKVGALETSAKTAETLAREMVANMGGSPLVVDSSDELGKLSREELIKASYETKDPVQLKEIAKQLKATK